MMHAQAQHQAAAPASTCVCLRFCRVCVLYAIDAAPFTLSASRGRRSTLDGRPPPGVDVERRRRDMISTPKQTTGARTRWFHRNAASARSKRCRAASSALIEPLCLSACLSAAA